MTSLSHSQCGGGLTFVHLTHPDDIRDRRVQTGIRRHVMKDIGRSRRGRPRHRVIPLEVALPGQIASIELDRRLDTRPGKMTRRKDAKASFRLLSSINFLGSYPVEPDQRALELLDFSKRHRFNHEQYRPNNCLLVRSDMDYKYRPFRIVWLRMAIADAATFNLSLAHGVVFLNELRRRAGYDFQHDTESVKYLSRTLKHLSYYLEDDTSRVSDVTVCTILGLACKDVSVPLLRVSVDLSNGISQANCGDWNQWSTHMNGLAQIHRLRGGFHGMGHDLPILALWLIQLFCAISVWKMF